MNDALLCHGTAEEFKGIVHLCLFGLAVACSAYGAMAFGERRERHLATNVLVYGALAYFESRQILRHMRAMKGDL